MDGLADRRKSGAGARHNRMPAAGGDTCPSHAGNVTCADRGVPAVSWRSDQRRFAVAGRWRCGRRNLSSSGGGRQRLLARVRRPRRPPRRRRPRRPRFRLRAGLERRPSGRFRPRRRPRRRRTRRRRKIGLGRGICMGSGWGCPPSAGRLPPPAQALRARIAELNTMAAKSEMRLRVSIGGLPKDPGWRALPLQR